jgi:hydrogenase nickel incorporation protein HypB
VDFDVEKFLARLGTVHPGVACIQVSARTGEGMEAWSEWLAQLPGRVLV